MKEQIVSQIESKLSELGIDAQKGPKTDLAIDIELLDAAFSTGKRKINYESMILVDESDQTIKMYEKTT